MVPSSITGKFGNTTELKLYDEIIIGPTKPKVVFVTKGTDLQRMRDVLKVHPVYHDAQIYVLEGEHSLPGVALGLRHQLIEENPQGIILPDNLTLPDARGQVVAFSPASDATFTDNQGKEQTLAPFLRYPLAPSFTLGPQGNIQLHPGVMNHSGPRREDIFTPKAGKFDFAFYPADAQLIVHEKNGDINAPPPAAYIQWIGSDQYSNSPPENSPKLGLIPQKFNTYSGFI